MLVCKHFATKENDRVLCVNYNSPIISYFHKVATFSIIYWFSFLCRWYFGKIKRVDAEKLLQLPVNQVGAFLIRDSETILGNYSLSIRDHESRMRHYRIERLDNGSFFITRKATFYLISELVAYYKQQADGLCCCLGEPCIRSAF